MITQAKVIKRLRAKELNKDPDRRCIRFTKRESLYLVALVVLRELEALGLVTVYDERTEVRATLTDKGRAS